MLRNGENSQEFHSFNFIGLTEKSAKCQDCKNWTTISWGFTVLSLNPNGQTQEQETKNPASVWTRGENIVKTLVEEGATVRM